MVVTRIDTGLNDPLRLEDTLMTIEKIIADLGEMMIETEETVVAVEASTTEDT